MKKYLFMFLGFAAAIFTALFSGKSIGKAKEREKQATKGLKQAKRSNEIDDTVRAMSDADLDRELHKHQRH